MSVKRRNYSADFKARVALTALKEQKTLAELASEFELQPTLISKWKAQAQTGLAAAFSDGRQNRLARSQAELIELLYRQIGQLQVELEWLKKKSGR